VRVLKAVLSFIAAPPLFFTIQWHMMGRNASEELFSLQGQPDHEYFDVTVMQILILIVAVTCGICSGVAVLTTIVCIAVRVRRQSRFWVDDVSDCSDYTF
jgi:hypothetical protein